ncbi:hypothetical protein CL635_00675 [bacterium]|mgnify:CR=1 FL=1|nr:hypothetical protein [bacterium]|tara:strand:- start:1029 stop:1442 length:414 start_codon:yes stop_codon:yes gene_type:complete
MRIFSIVLALTVLFPVAAQAEELTNSPQFRYRSHRTRAISRPSHRSVERNTRAYRAGMAASRRGFQNQLHRIEEARDALRKEYRRANAPVYDVNQQGFVPYNWGRTRRHVRHLYWQNHFQQAPGAKIGEGSAGEDQE